MNRLLCARCNQASWGATEPMFLRWRTGPERTTPLPIPQGLLDQRDRTVLTPHIGSAVQSIREDIAMTAARNLKALVESTLTPIR